MEGLTINYSSPLDDFVRTIDIHTLLPQQEPFVMIGSLIHFDMIETVTETSIVENNIFVQGGTFSSTGLLENIAQTCAVRIGYINKYINKKGIQIGLIGAVRNYEVFENPIVGSKIKTKIKVKEEIFGMIMAEAIVECNNAPIAKTEIKIAVTNEEV